MILSGSVGEMGEQEDEENADDETKASAAAKAKAKAKAKGKGKARAKGKAGKEGKATTGADNPPDVPSPSKTPSTLTLAQKLKGDILKECSSVERMLLTIEASSEGDEWNHLNNDQNFGAMQKSLNAFKNTFDEFDNRFLIKAAADLTKSEGKATLETQLKRFLRLEKGLSQVRKEHQRLLHMHNGALQASRPLKAR